MAEKETFYTANFQLITATGRWGVMPLLTERLPVKEKLTDLQKLALFAPFFNRAKVSQELVT